MKQRWNDKIRKVTALWLVLSLCLGIFPISGPREAEATSVKTSMREATEIANGTFELGRTGYSVKEWSLTAMSRGLSTAADYGMDDNTVQSYLRAFALKTEQTTDGNKVAALTKTGSGYVAMTSARFEVTAGEECWISYDYFLQDIQNRGDITNNREGVPFGVTDDDFHGIQMAVREYDVEGNAIAWTRLSSNGSYGEGKISINAYTTDASTQVKHYTSANWMTVSKPFVPTAQTETVELYLKVGAQSYVTGTVLFDNVNAATYDIFELPNGDFSAVTHDAEGGRAEDSMGPAGWTLSACKNNGNAETNASNAASYVANYVATIVDDTDMVGYNPVMRYQYKTLTSTGYAFIQSPSISVEAGEKFSASFRYKIEGQMAYTPKATVFFYDTNGVEISRHHTNLNKGPVAWTAATTSSFTVPDGAVNAKFGFFGSRRNDIQNVSGYPEEYTHTSGNRSYDTYTLYFDDVMINGKVAGWTAETSMAKGVPRNDNADFTDNYNIRRVNDGAGHERALQLYVSSASGTLGGVTYYSEPLDIVGGQQYAAAFDLKIQNYNSSDKNADQVFGAAYVLRYLDAEGNYLNASKPELVNDSPKDNMNWTRFVYIVTPPAQAVKAQVGLVIGSYQKDICKGMSYSWDNLVLMETGEYQDSLKDPAVVNSSLYEETALFVGDSIGSGMVEAAQFYSEMVVTNACTDSLSVYEQLAAHAGETYEYLILSLGKNEATANLPAGNITDSSIYMSGVDFDTTTFAGVLEQTFAKIAEYYDETRVICVLPAEAAGYKEVAQKATDKWNVSLVILKEETEPIVNWNEVIEPAEGANLFVCYEIPGLRTYLSNVLIAMKNRGIAITDIAQLNRLLQKAQGCPETHADYNEYQELAEQIETTMLQLDAYRPEIYGATIAKEDPNQLCFVAGAPKKPLTKEIQVKKMGVLVIPQELLTKSAAGYVADAALELGNVYAKDLPSDYTAEGVPYYGILSLDDVKPTVEYTATAYIVYEAAGAEYIFYSNNDYVNAIGSVTAEDGRTTKSVYGIAKDIATVLSTECKEQADFTAIGGIQNILHIETATKDSDISLYDVYCLTSDNKSVLEAWLAKGGITR